MGFDGQQGLKYYQFSLFTGFPLFHAVLTRQGGYSEKPFESLNTGGTVGDDPHAVRKNHQKIYDVLGFDYYSRFDVWQVHGTEVLCTDQPRPRGMPHQKADGVMTDRSDVTLFMRFADCVPILLFDPIKHVIGIIHAGWQGTAKKIAKTAVEKMVACYDSLPENIMAGIGPSICQDCYEVGTEVYTSFEKQFGKQAGTFFQRVNRKYHLDLWGANQAVLREVGVDQIEVCGLCTACHLEDWYSHRAEKGKTGRFGVLMALEN